VAYKRITKGHRVEFISSSCIHPFHETQKKPSSLKSLFVRLGVEALILQFVTQIG